MYWCGSKKHLRTESRKDIEEMIKMKLETIEEESDGTSRDEIGTITKQYRRGSSKMRKSTRVVIKTQKSFTVKWTLKQSYVIFMNGFASKGGISGLPRY